MSTWGDMCRRAEGEEMRREDLFNPPYATKAEVDAAMGKPIIFMGVISDGLVPCDPKDGEIYYVQDNCDIDGFAHNAGEMLIYYGGKFQTISMDPVTTSAYIGQ